MKKAALFLGLIALVIAVKAQTPLFSQYYATGLYLNPALAGVEPTMRFGINYRSQWSEQNLSFHTMQASLIYPVVRPGVRPKHLGGLGLSVFRDQAGAAGSFETSGGTASYAYNFHLNKYGNNILAIGGQLGCYQLGLNDENLHWSSQYNSSIGFDATVAPGAGEFGYQSTYAVVNMGLMWYYKNKYRYSSREFHFYNGFSISNLNRPSFSFIEDAKVSMLYKLHGGLLIHLTPQWSISPNYLIQYEDTNFQTNSGAYFSYKPGNPSPKNTNRLTIGAWYRLQDSFILSAGYTSRHFEIAVSYDHNISSLSRYLGNTGAFEFSLAYKLGRKNQFKRYATPMI